MGSRFAVVIVVALASAGCIGAEERPVAAVEDAAPIETAVMPPGTGELADAAAAAVPVWNVGDAWTGTTRDGDTERPLSLVVTRADGGYYTIETTDDRTAGWDAMYDLSYVGRIRASDLAGSQRDTPVQFYSFPLVDGKTWTTQWDGDEVQLTATKSVRGFDIVGTVDGEPYVELDYVHELRWWSRLDFVRDDYGIIIDRVQSGWKGSLAKATAKLLYEGQPASAVGSPGAGTFKIDEGQTFGLVTIFGGGERWARAFYLVQPDGTPFMTSSVENFELEGAGPRDIFLSEEIPPTPGDWRIVAPSVHDAQGGFFVSVHQVATSLAPFG